MPHDEREPPLLESKLYPATGTRDPLARPRLDSRSEVLEGDYPVVLLFAPAGYGKSTLMARWHSQLIERGVPCAWISADENDADKVRFVRHLIAALHKALPRFGESAASTLSADFASDVKTIMEVLAAELAAVRERIVFFLDDVHFIHEPEVLEIVDWLVNYAPRTVQRIIGTRDRRHLRLSALRVRRQLFELDMRQLQFDAEEASRFYRSRLGQDLPARDLQRLLTKTEGWPAALELVALAIAGLPEQARFIERFAGTDTSLVEYLGEVVLSQMDERTRTLAFRISMFDRVNASLAQALGDSDDSDDPLQALRMRNLFLIPLDQEGTWVRFHHLVGEFFRERYRRRVPAQAKECLIRGAHWLHANGYVEDAVSCLIRAEDWEQATRWVAESVEELVFRRGYHQTILRWMNALPEVWVDRYPVIRIQYAFSLSFYPRHREYEAQIYRLQQLLESLQAQSGDARRIDELRCAVELQTALATGLRDEGTRGGELAAGWLASWPQASLRQKGVMGNVLAFGLKSAGEIARGLEVIAETRAWLERSEGYYALAWTAYLEALLNLKRGSYLEARLASKSGMEIVRRELQGHPVQASMLHAVLAAVAYEFDEIGEAADHIEQAVGSVNDGHADAVILAHITQARLQRLRDDPESARAILREGQGVGERRGLRRVVLSLAAEECSQLARTGHYEEARLLATRFGFSELPAESTGLELIQDKAVRGAARYLIQESPLRVIEALDRSIESSERRDFAHRSVELLLIRALAHKHNADEGSALTDLQRALSIGAPKSYLRVFLDEGPELASLIDRLNPERLRGSQTAPLLRRLRSSQPRTGRQPPDATPVGRESLTRREVSILKHLDSGLSNKEIAEAIFVSEGTLKWHLHNVYGKLDVKNRTGAMARARALKIV